MSVRLFHTLVVGTALLLPIPTFAQDTTALRQAEMSTPTDSGFASVNGLELYYESHGSGDALLLLHGGVAASEVFGANLTELARNRQVIVAHMQGHGHTRDIDRPLRYELMADDVAGLISHLGLDRVDLLGYSMGGGIAIQTAVRHPNVVRKLVIVSQAMKRDGWYPEVLAAIDDMAANAASLAEGVAQSPLGERYPNTDWETLFRKMGEMESHDYDWSADVAAIDAPTMIIFADADAIRPEHIVDFYRLFGGGQRDAGLDGSARPVARLAIIPGATHYDILNGTHVAKLVEPFLSAPAPNQ